MAFFTSFGCLAWRCWQAPRCQGMGFQDHKLAPFYRFSYLLNKFGRLIILTIHLKNTYIQSSGGGESLTHRHHHDRPCHHHRQCHHPRHHLESDDRLDLIEGPPRSALTLLQRLHNRDLSALLVDTELVLVVSLQFTMMTMVMKKVEVERKVPKLTQNRRRWYRR